MDYLHEYVTILKSKSLFKQWFGHYISILKTKIQI